MRDVRFAQTIPWVHYYIHGTACTPQPAKISATCLILLGGHACDDTPRESGFKRSMGALLCCGLCASAACMSNELDYSTQHNYQCMGMVIHGAEVDCKICSYLIPLWIDSIVKNFQEGKKFLSDRNTGDSGKQSEGSLFLGGFWGGGCILKHCSNNVTRWGILNMFYWVPSYPFEL